MQLNRLLAFFRPPIFPEDDDKTRKASYAHSISLAFTGVILAYILFLWSSGRFQLFVPANIVLVVLAFAGLINWWLLRRGNVLLPSILLVGLLWAGINGIAASGYGLRDTSFITNFVVMLIAALLLGWRAAIFVGLASILTAFGLAYGETQGLILVPEYPVTAFAQDISVVLVLAAYFIYILVTGLENAIKRSKTSLIELAAANTELHDTQSDLQLRSAELVSANAALQKRTERLRALAEVARTATAVQDFDELLPLITNIVSNQLGYYHVGIFLMDEFKEYVILRAANTEGGLQMLARGHRLRVGEEGIVGFVAQTGAPHVALDVGKEAVYFDNPDLPGTRSELALPLKVSGSNMGILDLQSTEPNAFDEEDVALLTILADQIAIAIQNALSLEQTQRALREAELASRQASGQAWEGYTSTAYIKGYRYDGVKSEAITRAASDGQKDQEALFVPVRLRGQTIGQLKLKASTGNRLWTEDELAIIESTAERVAIALESARLLDEAQKRASRETFLSEMGAKLGTSFQLDSILRDTVEELGQTLKGSTVSFQLINPSAPPSAESNNGSGERNYSA